MRVVQCINGADQERAHTEAIVHTLTGLYDAIDEGLRKRQQHEAD